MWEELSAVTLSWLFCLRSSVRFMRNNIILQNQMIEIALGFMILFISLNLSWNYVRSNKIIYAVGAVILIAINIGVYQSFCILYIAGVCFQILISYKKEFVKERKVPERGRRDESNSFGKRNQSVFNWLFGIYNSG